MGLGFVQIRLRWRISAPHPRLFQRVIGNKYACMSLIASREPTRLQQLKPIASGIDDSDDIDHFGFLVDGVKNHITFHDELPVSH